MGQEAEGDDLMGIAGTKAKAWGSLWGSVSEMSQGRETPESEALMAALVALRRMPPVGTDAVVEIEKALKASYVLGGLRGIEDFETSMRRRRGL